MKNKNIDDALMLKLENDKYYYLEDLSKELKFPRADIHKSFARLKMQSGWSITPSNSTAYWRENTLRMIRGLKDLILYKIVEGKRARCIIILPLNLIGSEHTFMLGDRNG